MRVRSLSLEQFRNYDSLTLDIEKGSVHVLLGENGAGKTNILEALSILSLTKSCLGTEEADLLRWGTEYYRVRADVVSDAGEELTLEVVSQIAPRKQKACFVRDVRTPVSEMVGLLPVVLFLPRDLELFTGQPAERRRFLDQMLCQVSPLYLQHLATYQKILKQRNSLLRHIREGNARPSDLEVWNTTLAETGASVTVQRLELMEVLQCSLPKELEALSEAWEDVELCYLRKGESHTQEECSRELLQLLQHYQERDILLSSTTVGPHRDDWELSVEGRNITTFASRGQQRTAVLALQFLEVSFLELRRNEKPIILLDDVFSELDDRHQCALLESFDAHQVLITTTHLPTTLHDAHVWEVRDGVVERSRDTQAMSV